MLYTLETAAMYSFSSSGAFLSRVCFTAREPRGSGGSAPSIGARGSSMRDTKMLSICSSSFQSSSTERTCPMPKTSWARQSTLNLGSATSVITADTTSFHSVPPSAVTMPFRAAVITIFIASQAIASQYFLASGSGACVSKGIAGKCCMVRKRRMCLQGSGLRARYPEVKRIRRLAAHRRSIALKPCVGYGSCGSSSISLGMTVSCPAFARDATPVSTNTHASMSCQAMGCRVQISSSRQPMWSIIQSGVTTRQASVILMEHISRNLTKSSHSKFSSCSGSAG
mmetsp:Transcript_42794/g.110653  ORF Transcript_42794/g.110653 Transcript_42794/m.110653 type:complete len:283 (+) Transcript_42794:698-1546(+)